MTKYVAIWTVQSEAVQYDGTEESWKRVRALPWLDCYPMEWPDTRIMFHGYGDYTQPGEWVAVDEAGRLFVVSADKVQVADQEDIDA